MVEDRKKYHDNGNQERKKRGGGYQRLYEALDENRSPGKKFCKGISSRRRRRQDECKKKKKN